MKTTDKQNQMQEINASILQKIVEFYGVEIKDIKRYLDEMKAYISKKHPEILTSIDQSGQILKENEDLLGEAISSFSKIFVGG